jgi:hypothetical protein
MFTNTLVTDDGAVRVPGPVGTPMVTPLSVIGTVRGLVMRSSSFSTSSTSVGSSSERIFVIFCGGMPSWAATYLRISARTSGTATRACSR